MRLSLVPGSTIVEAGTGLECFRKSKFFPESIAGRPRRVSTGTTAPSGGSRRRLENTIPSIQAPTAVHYWGDGDGRTRIDSSTQHHRYPAFGLTSRPAPWQWSGRRRKVVDSDRVATERFDLGHPMQRCNTWSFGRIPPNTPRETPLVKSRINARIRRNLSRILLLCDSGGFIEIGFVRLISSNWSFRHWSFVHSH